jgi:hypothetical protein
MIVGRDVDNELRDGYLRDQETLYELSTDWNCL